MDAFQPISDSLKAAVPPPGPPWQVFFREILSWGLGLGPRGAPRWVTPKFQGNAVLTPTEDELARKLGLTDLPLEHRQALYAALLEPPGLQYLAGRLEARDYSLSVPEEAALLVVIFLARQGQLAAAAALLKELSPWFHRMRFYPLRSSRGAGCYLQDLEYTRLGLMTQPERHGQFVAMRESFRRRRPLLDELVGLWAETVVDGWPGRRFPQDWKQRGRRVLADWDSTLGPTRWGCSGQQGFLCRCLAVACHDVANLKARELGKVRKILEDIQRAHGLPGSTRHQQLRQRQLAESARATTAELAAVLLERLPLEGTLSEVQSWLAPVTAEEAQIFGVPAGQALPFERVLRRSWAAPLAELVACGTIASAEMLARLFPQLSSQVEGARYQDPQLAYLIKASYQAFRGSRVEQRVRFGELPWIKSVSAYRAQDSPGCARRLLEEAVQLWLSYWPYSVAPNALVREFRILAPELPWLEELYPETFHKALESRFARAARCAARLLQATAYERYYRLPMEELLGLADQQAFSPPFVGLCRQRAGIPGRDRRAYRARLVEQQQILTTQNLAVLTEHLGLQYEVAQVLKCLRWLTRRKWRGKRCGAFAFRQLVFILSRLSPVEQEEALNQGEAWLQRFPSKDFQLHWQELTRAVRGEALTHGPWLAWE